MDTRQKYCCVSFGHGACSNKFNIPTTPTVKFKLINLASGGNHLLELVNLTRDRFGFNLKNDISRFGKRNF